MRCCVFPAILVISFAVDAGAQSASPATGAPLDDRGVGDGAPVSEPMVAREHFERALTWYRKGKYRDAEAELTAALERDPKGKDLVFNLALVQEKLGDLDGAIVSLQRFQSMEKDPKELERAAQAIERLQGAHVELLAARPRQRPVRAEPCPLPSAQRGKFDAWVIGTGTFTIASFLVGTVLGVRALSLGEPAERSRARDAAVMADFAFATSLLAGAGTFALYWGRFADPTPARSAPSQALPTVSMARFVIRY